MEEGNDTNNDRDENGRLLLLQGSLPGTGVTFFYRTSDLDDGHDDDDGHDANVGGTRSTTSVAATATGHHSRSMSSFSYFHQVQQQQQHNINNNLQAQSEERSWLLSFESSVHRSATTTTTLQRQQQQSKPSTVNKSIDSASSLQMLWLHDDDDDDDSYDGHDENHQFLEQRSNNTINRRDGTGESVNYYYDNESHDINKHQQQQHQQLYEKHVSSYQHPQNDYQYYDQQQQQHRPYTYESFDRNTYHTSSNTGGGGPQRRKMRLHQASAVAAAYRQRQDQIWAMYCKIFLSFVVGTMLFISLQYQHHHQHNRHQNVDSPTSSSSSGSSSSSSAAATPYVSTIHTVEDESRDDDDEISDLFLRGQVQQQHDDKKSNYSEPTEATTSTTSTGFVVLDDSNNKAYIDDDDDRRTKILTALKNLDEEIQGDIVLMSNKTKFVVAAQVWQSSVRPPLAVVEATSTHDVSISLPILAGLQRDYDIPFRIRSGGHTYMSDYSNIPDGIVLSLSRMTCLSFSSGKLSDSATLMTTDGGPDHKNDCDHGLVSSISDTGDDTVHTIMIQPGVTAEMFMKEVLYEHGFVGIVPSAAHVGMGGFLLGGGYGLQSRLYGLAIDNIVRIQAVLMNGTQVVVDQDDDLFWALRGAGGANFAVVTDVEYRVYPSNDIKLCASARLSLDSLSGFLQGIGQMEPNLAPEFTLTVEGYHPPDNRPSPDSELTRSRTKQMLVAMNYTFIGNDNNADGGDDEDNDDTGFVDVKMYWTGQDSPETKSGINYIKTKIEPTLKATTLVSDIVYYYFSWSGMSRADEQDESWKSVWSAQSWNGFLLPKNNTDAVWIDILSSFEAMFRYCDYATPKVSLWGGAISDRLPNETAFPHRSALYSIGVELLVPDGTTKGMRDQVELINAIWPSIARHLTGVYVNQPMASLSQDNDSDHYPEAYWGSNLNQLMVLKQKYDPYHSLVHDQSIPIINVTLLTSQLGTSSFDGSARKL
jgi:FAD binding domain/Berberine and berberine like